MSPTVPFFQVAPAELERILLTHPMINEAAVVGVPDERAGELPRAYIVVKPGQNLTETEVKDFIKGKSAVIHLGTLLKLFPRCEICIRKKSEKHWI